MIYEIYWWLSVEDETKLASRLAGFDYVMFESCIKPLRRLGHQTRAEALRIGSHRFTRLQCTRP
jgi:hypothetical protein